SRRRFGREARAAGMLDHPGIVRVLDYGEDGRPFLVMEYLEGVSLRRHIRREKPDQVELLGLFLELCPALHHAHSRGVVHRDIKPDNIFVTTEGRLKILDFGLARMVASQLSMLTRSGTALGTCTYMSPEQAAGKDADPRSDLYSLGIMLFEFLCGEVPFSAQDPASILYKQVHEEPPRPTSLNPDLHPELEAFLLRLLAKDPARRPPDAPAVAAELARLQKLLAGTPSASQSLPEVAAALAVEMATLPEAAPAEVEGQASLLSADVPDFARLTRDRGPLEVTRMQAELTRELETSVASHAGQTLERQGTRIVAAFCGPDHGLRAVRAVTSMRTRVQTFLRRHALPARGTIAAGIYGGKLPRRENGSWEEVARQELLHGATRLELLAREHPDSILICGESLDQHLPVEPLRRLYIRGRREPVQVYRVLGA
ncbi:MAG TPA: protein kinase, partial [Candidatus Nitrosotenuis sp.]|nr:protein kinase [Candidatus Nitrosotenuis sp.]